MLGVGGLRSPLQLQKAVTWEVVWQFQRLHSGVSRLGFKVDWIVGRKSQLYGLNFLLCKIGVVRVTPSRVLQGVEEIIPCKAQPSAQHREMVATAILVAGQSNSSAETHAHLILCTRKVMTGLYFLPFWKDPRTPAPSL